MIRKNCFYLISMTIIMMISSYLFQDTQGLLYIMDHSNEDITIKYVSALLSSGSNDNMLIGLYDWFYIPLIVLYLFNKCNITRFILGTYFFIVFLQLLSLMLLDVGSIYETIIYGKNLILLLWLISYLLVIGTILYGFFNYKSFSNEKEKEVSDDKR